MLASYYLLQLLLLFCGVWVLYYTYSNKTLLQTSFENNYIYDLIKIDYLSVTGFWRLYPRSLHLRSSTNEILFCTILAMPLSCDAIICLKKTNTVQRKTLVGENMVNLVEVFSLKFTWSIQYLHFIGRPFAKVFFSK